MPLFLMDKKDSSYVSWMMSRIKGKNNNLEKAFRKGLCSQGICGYRIDDKKVLGSPDICFEGLKIAIFIDGDFWHGYEWDKNRSLLTSRNKIFWINKIERNMLRDFKVTYELEQSGFIVLRFWEHEIREDIEGCLRRVKEVLHQRKLERSFKVLR